MKGAIFYSTKYGSTAEYANWISEATGLPVFNVKDVDADPSKYDFLILGSPIIYLRLSIRKWVRKHLSRIAQKPIIFFSVSGAPPGSKLNGWIAKSLPASFISNMNHVALQGRQVPAELSWFDWVMLKIAGMVNRDPQASKDEIHGFDYMDKTSIEPIIELAREFQTTRLSKASSSLPA